MVTFQSFIKKRKRKINLNSKLVSNERGTRKERLEKQLDEMGLTEEKKIEMRKRYFFFFFLILSRN